MSLADPDFAVKAGLKFLSFFNDLVDKTVYKENKGIYVQKV